jgi:uracil-DNA glycosylase
MQLKEEWRELLAQEFQKDYYKNLEKFIEYEYKTKTVFPKYEDIFRAFDLLTPEKVRVLILGQDPYHGANQANGLAFSVNSRSKIPPSLRNIYKELVDDIGCKTPANGNLTPWAKQGVLLFNTVFSVLEGSANSHKEKGWEILSDSIIEKLSQTQEHIVFILWGAASQKKASLIDETKHLILSSAHPSPLSAYRGFFGSKPFSKANEYLQSNNLKAIEWCLPSQETLL